MDGQNLDTHGSANHGENKNDTNGNTYVGFISMQVLNKSSKNVPDLKLFQFPSKPDQLGLAQFVYKLCAYEPN